MVHSDFGMVASHQAYYTFTHTLLQNVRVSDPVCVLTGTVTADHALFDATLQNEVCNGPANCTFRGINVPPGSAAYASGTLINPPISQTDFRVASMGICATAPGQAVLRWEFSPTRMTMVGESPQANPVNCYRDYVIIVK
jgi:hypothetical protein